LPATINAPRRELRRNYIAAIRRSRHKFDEQCADELQARSEHLVKACLLRLMAAIRKRRADAG
jgi:hypothetical protein